jgi:release factor glutamine methyltransferase
MVPLSGLWLEVRDRLRAGAIETPDLDAALLLENATGVDAKQRILAPDLAISAESAAALHALVEKRLAGTPVHRLLGYREFYGRRFLLGPDALEPRPDSEAIVEAGLAFVRACPKDRIAVLDLGTGSGALGLTVAAECPEVEVMLSDVSAGALSVARANATALGLLGRTRLVQSDWFAAVEGTFDLIISNPPYIATGDLAGLSREVFEHDPLLALDGGTDGLNPYRVIAAEGADFLRPQGQIIVEHGHDQHDAVVALFEQHGYEAGAALTDLAGHRRGATFLM